MEKSDASFWDLQMIKLISNVSYEYKETNIRIHYDTYRFTTEISSNSLKGRMCKKPF